jgi:cell wall-associated NlpC family hydrolase
MISEASQRAAVVAEARSWVGTPYHNCADVKRTATERGGVDCGMLIVRVFCDTGLLPPFDPRPYPADWHLHRGEEKYLEIVRRHGRKVDTPQPGDLAMFQFGRCAAHGGIVTVAKPLTVVHAYQPSRCVLEDEVARDANLAGRLRGFFSFWAK